MFRESQNEYGKLYRIAISGILLLSIVALAITIWVELDFLKEQELVAQLIQQLPQESTATAKELAGELRWQFRLTILVVLNLVVTGCAVMLLARAYRTSQESLRDVKALAANILSSIDQAVITTNKTSHITSINRRGLELLSLEIDCIGMPLKNITAVPLKAFCDAWQKDPSPTMVQDYKTCVNSTERTLRAFCQTLCNDAGENIGHVLQLRDVTRRVLIEDRMRRMERYMGLGSLAAGLHHEIKNPLAALSLHVQLLEEQIESERTSEDALQMLGVIKTELSRIGGVLDGFKDLATNEQLYLEPVDVIKLIQRRIELSTPRAEQKNIRIQTDLNNNIRNQIPADRVRIEQVLLNLILNGMEAMPDGGTLTISAAIVDTNIQIDVCDTGTGIPEDLHDRIFDPYFTTKNDGTGLGLAYSDKIMNQHQGSLSFQSSPEGTCFRMILPCSNGSVSS